MIPLAFFLAFVGFADVTAQVPACYDSSGPRQCALLQTAGLCILPAFNGGCRRTCGLCQDPASCTDTNIGGPCSATSVPCTSTMTALQCPVTCRQCVPSDSSSCFDVQPSGECTTFIATGECVAYTPYMTRLCMRTCGLCRKQPSPTCPQKSNGPVTCSRGSVDCACDVQPGTKTCPSGVCHNYCLFGVPSRYCV